MASLRAGKQTMNDYAGKTAVVTGASSGIGRALSHQLAARGARVILTARRQAVLEEVAREIEPAEGIPMAADLRDPTAITRLSDEIKRRVERVDLLVNNAGVGLHRAAIESPSEIVRQLFELNVFGPVELTRQLVPLMPHGGAVVNVSSIAGKVPLPNLNLYSASKYALNAFSDGLSMELRGKGIHVMTVCPGYVETAFGDSVLLGKMSHKVPGKKRFAISADECALAILEGLGRGKRTVVTPRIGWLFIGIARLIPGFLFGRMAGHVKLSNDPPENA